MVIRPFTESQLTLRQRLHSGLLQRPVTTRRRLRAMVSCSQYVYTNTQPYPSLPTDRPLNNRARASLILRRALSYTQSTRSGLTCQCTP